MRKPEIKSNIKLITAVHKYFSSPHFNFLQCGDQITSNIPGYRFNTDIQPIIPDKPITFSYETDWAILINFGICSAQQEQFILADGSAPILSIGALPTVDNNADSSTTVNNQLNIIKLFDTVIIKSDNIPFQLRGTARLTENTISRKCTWLNETNIYKIFIHYSKVTDTITITELFKIENQPTVETYSCNPSNRTPFTIKSIGGGNSKESNAESNMNYNVSQNMHGIISKLYLYPCSIPALIDSSNDNQVKYIQNRLVEEN